MADPEDRMQPDGSPPDGRPRRPPPIIEGEAVEISADGLHASGAGAPLSAAGGLLMRIRMLLPPGKIAAGIAVGVAVAAIVLGTSWVYLATDGAGPPPAKAGLEQTPSENGSAGHAADAAATRPTPADDAAAGTAELESRLAAVDGTVAALNQRVAELDRMLRDSTEAARAAAERADNIARQLEAAKKSDDEQDAAQQLDRGALDDLASRIKTLESRQMTLRQVQERLDRLASAAGAPDKVLRMTVAAAALRNAVERDRPFPAELAAARAVGLDSVSLASLEPFAAYGLPKRNELLRELTALLPELRRMSAPPGQDLGYLDRIQASAARMLNIRPVKDEPGDDPPAVLSRVELRMLQQDVDFGAIVAELDKLPAPAKEVVQAWRVRALARRDAMDAARLIATESLAKLGEPAPNGSLPQ